MNLKEYYGKVRILTPKESLTTTYPQAIEYAQQQQEIIWFAEELNIPNDTQDIRTRCTEGERHGVSNVLKLFSQYEGCLGEEIWGDKIMRMFPHPCIRRMAATFSFMELGVHQPFYQEINKTLNLETDEFYLSWHNDDRLVKRMEFIDKYVDEDHPLLATAAFAFLEGVVLFSSFAFLRSFGSNGFNLLPRIVSGINASSKDEFMHARASCWLYNQCKKEIIEAGVVSPSSIENIEEEILQIAQTAYEHEEAISDMIFEINGIRTITKEDMLEFVRNRVDDVLKDLGIRPIFGDAPGPISEWFYNNVSLYSYSDFFAQQSIEYNRQWRKMDLIFRGGAK